ncbi:DUF887-domain-containing protein [Massarina eburnea CBS 473.64]|uniref:DUF887-domain-containing protein n=1 Tax=Massarina eburnea CBS 473.64 TaxID=1395130 RepID=A0A6A6S9B3_9PLEO|nr:DUF887-domain-containing protein [Massarina eburnea CBS 473.64]
MHDPFPIVPPEWLPRYVQPVAEYLSLQTLPLHIHEVTFAFCLYYGIHQFFAPFISNLLVPRTYASFSSRTRLSWNVHIVSFVQSTLICVLALWVMATDEERKNMDWSERVYGYTGAGGLVQALAGGYFVWDLVITLQNMSVFGPGMLAHAVSALFVFALGFRPFVNFYAPTFILYELSTFFLNIHWFCDKLNMTGSALQLYNGILLLCTFAGCRLGWGSYQSVQVFSDVYRAIIAGDSVLTYADAELGKLSNDTAVDSTSEMMRFAGNRVVPLWLAGCYLLSNLTLNGLNWYWFGKMIETIRKRFDPPLGTRKPEEKELDLVNKEKDKVLVEGTAVNTPPPSLPTTPYANSNGEQNDYMGAVKVAGTGKHLEVAQSEIRKREKTIGSARAA